MAKMIKFNLVIDGNKVSTFEEMQDNLSAELLPHLPTGKLAKWFLSRDMADKAAAVQAIDTTQTNLAQLTALCEVLELEADEDVLADILARPEQLAQAQVAQSKDWSGRDLSGRSFEGEDFSNYNFAGANLSGVNLTRAYLTGADLRLANGSGLLGSDRLDAIASLPNRDQAIAMLMSVMKAPVGKLARTLAAVRDANLSFAYLRRVNLRHANLSNANLLGVRLSSADLTGAKGANFTGAKVK